MKRLLKKYSSISELDLQFFQACLEGNFYENGIPEDGFKKLMQYENSTINQKAYRVLSFDSWLVTELFDDVDDYITKNEFLNRIMSLIELGRISSWTKDPSKIDQIIVDASLDQGDVVLIILEANVYGLDVEKFYNLYGKEINSEDVEYYATNEKEIIGTETNYPKIISINHIDINSLKNECDIEEYLSQLGINY